MESVDVFLLILMSAHILLCPYAKVEESFNLQAIHDLLYYQTELSSYDHNTFPGVVPRTFLGAITVAAFTFPFKWIGELFKRSKFETQICSRIVLGMLVFGAFKRLKKAIATKFGRDTATCFILITSVQFHLIFYMGRTLPNIFSLILVILAFSCWVNDNAQGVIVLLSICTIVFRGDTAVVFAPILLMLLFTRQISFVRMVFIGIASAVVALATTVVVDSFFWQRWLWPEGEVLWFNTVLNKSHEWGTQPFLWYFTSAIPRSMLTTLFLVPIGLRQGLGKSRGGATKSTSIVDKRALQYFVPIVVYLLLFSILPHKELRFIFNALPILNMIAALGLAKSFRLRKKTILPSLFGLLCVAATFLGSFVFLYASYLNYPGGEAFYQLHKLRQSEVNTEIRVHIDVPAAMTGVSRFGELNSKWIYSKEEELKTVKDFAEFDYLLTATPDDPGKQDFEVLGKPISIFARYNYRRLKAVTRPHTYLMKRQKH